ncbi:MAG: hypothetical protein C5B54_00610, partial [Acidobacteria bacterium]
KLSRSGLADEVLAAQQTDNSSSADPERIYTFAESVQPEVHETTKAPEQLETWVTFLLAGEIFSLPVSHVQEILRVGDITRVPHAPYPVRGIVNMRGRILPLVDLRLRIALPQAQITAASRILVISSKGKYIGLLVDAVHQVIRISRGNVQPAPSDVMTEQSDYIIGVYHHENKLVILLDVERVLLIKETAQAS